MKIVLYHCTNVTSFELILFNLQDFCLLLLKLLLLKLQFGSIIYAIIVNKANEMAKETEVNKTINDILFSGITNLISFSSTK